MIAAARKDLREAGLGAEFDSPSPCAMAAGGERKPLEFNMSPIEEAAK
jgi:hypothetical protein